MSTWRHLRPARLRAVPLPDAARCRTTRRRPAGQAAAGTQGAGPAADPARIRLGVGRADRNRGGLERRAGLQAAGAAPRPDGADPDGHVLRHDLPRDQLPGRAAGHPARPDRAEQTVISQLARTLVGDGPLPLPGAALDGAAAGAGRQHRLRRLPAVAEHPGARSVRAAPVRFPRRSAGVHERHRAAFASCPRC